MRVALPLLAACAILSACSSSSPPPVQSGPPTVSFQMTGDDLAPTNIQAQNECRQYGHTAQFQGLRPTSAGNRAIYTCDGPLPAPTAAAPSSLSGTSVVPSPPPAAAPGPPTSLSAPK